MRVLLFGGTVEGRKLAEMISDSWKSSGDNNDDVKIESCHVCVATEYGASLLPKNDRMIIHHERMDEDAITELINSTGFDICIDATHPYAVMISRNIRTACDACGVKLYRVLRKDSAAPAVSRKDYGTDAGIGYFDSIHSAVSYLDGTRGNILTSTGSKELKEFTLLRDYKTRVYARVLPVKDVVAACEELGFSASNLYCMQGPFSVEMNVAMINACKARYIVTKSSGSAGGFEEKAEAAMRTGAELIIIGRPSEESGTVYSLDEIIDVLGIRDDTFETSRKTAYIIGAGCGDGGQLTLDALRAIRDSSCVIGASRVIDSLKNVSFCDLSDMGAGDGCPGLMNDKDVFVSYNAEEIIRYINTDKPDKAALVYSGDIGFYSGAAGIEGALEGYRTVHIPGISSGICLCDKLGIPWQDVRFLSCHGRELDIEESIRGFDRILILLGGEKDAGSICDKLCKLGRGRARICIGERLSYDDEKITEGYAQELTDLITDPLAVMLIVNEV